MSQKFETIVFIGAGHLASHLSKALSDKGFKVIQLWRRGDDLCQDADLYIVAVPDEAIDEVRSLIPEKAFWVHTSANYPVSERAGAKNGVFYPLQTFTKGIDVDFTEIPIFVESANKQLESELLRMAALLSENIYLSTTEQRRRLHLGAVFASNFSNHMMAIAEHLLKEENLDFDLLKPLIKQTFKKAENHSPREMQTGPAVRGDKQVMKMQQKNLKGNLKDIYKQISKSIESYRPTC